MFEERQADAHASTPTEVEKPFCINSKELLAGRREIAIVHNGREYRLRETQNGKLILTA